MPKKSVSPIKMLVLDILKPHTPNIVEFCQELTAANGIENIDISVYAVDEKTESVKMVLEGSSLNFEVIRGTIENFGAVVHSVDKVCAGKKACSLQLPDLMYHKPF